MCAHTNQTCNCSLIMPPGEQAEAVSCVLVLQRFKRCLSQAPKQNFPFSLRNSLFKSHHAEQIPPMRKKKILFSHTPLHSWGACTREHVSEPSSCRQKTSPARLYGKTYTEAAHTASRIHTRVCAWAVSLCPCRCVDPTRRAVLCNSRFTDTQRLPRQNRFCGCGCFFVFVFFKTLLRKISSKAFPHWDKIILLPLK